MTTKFERDKVYKTRDGREARVICVDAPGNKSLAALIGTFGNSNEAEVLRFYADGRFYVARGATSGADLMLPKPEPIVEWGILTASGLFDAWENEATVKRYMAYNPIAPGSRLAKRTTEIVE